MEEELFLKAEVRKQTGSKDAARVRKQGRIPAVVYGHEKEPVAVSLDAHSLGKGVQRGQRLANVQIGRMSEKVLVKDLQYDHLGKDIIHVDLMRVDVSEMVKVRVPIELKGTAKGTHEGGILEEHVDHLEVECKVTDIPDCIVVSVKDIDIGDSLHAGEIELLDGVKLVSDPSMLMIACSLVAAAKTTEELEEEAPAAPEVIAEAKKAEEGEGPSEGEQEKRKT